MLKPYSELFKSLMLVNDLMLLTLSWWLAYLVRFEANLSFLPEVHIFRHYVIAWLLLLMVYAEFFWDWTCIDRAVFRRTGVRSLTCSGALPWLCLFSSV